MKKLILCLCFFVCVFACTFCFFGCESVNYKMLNANLAEQTKVVFAGESDQFKVNFKTGLREKPYEGDGVAQKNVEFGVITCYVVGKKLSEHKMNFELFIDEQSFEGEFLINPLDNSFVFDIEKEILDAEKIEVVLKFDGKSQKLALKNALGNSDLNYQDAMKIACKHLVPAIKQMKTGSKLNGEVYVRLISNVSSKSKFFWYISIYSTNHQIFGVIIDPSSAQVLAKKL